MTASTQAPAIATSSNVLDVEKFIRMEKALKEIRDAHRFNVASMPAHAVHALCFIALEDAGSQ